MDDKRFTGYCTICGDEKTVRDIGLYTVGSEGTQLCHECEMDVVKFVQQKRSEAGVARKERFKAERAARAN